MHFHYSRPDSSVASCIYFFTWWLRQIHYECSLENGVRVDSTRDRNQPLHFQVGAKQVIYGLDVAVQNMTLGQHVEVTIPHLYAYGQRGHPPKIPPQSTLIFRLELLDIEDDETPHIGYGDSFIRRTFLKHRSTAPPNLM
jgi:hypothetical protein